MIPYPRCLLPALAALVFACTAAEAQITLTEAGRQMDALRTAVRTVKLAPVPAPDGSYAYYDILAEDICDGRIGTLSEAWTAQPYVRAVVSRSVMLNATVHYPGARGKKSVVLFMRSNVTGEDTVCQPVVALAVPRQQKVRVTFELVTTAAPGERTVYVVTKAVPALARFVEQKVAHPYAKISARVLYAMSPSVETVKKLLPGPVGAKTPMFTLDAGLERATLMDGEQRVFTLRKELREQLLAFRPGESSHVIADSIDEIGSKTWAEILKSATRDQEWSSSSAAARRFCTALRTALLEALQNDVLAMKLGLYHHAVAYRLEYERVKTSCLARSEMQELVEKGYAPPQALSF